MNKVNPVELPHLSFDALHEPELVKGLIKLPTVAIDGLACAMDLRSTQQAYSDPLLGLETAIAVRLGCSLDSKGFPKTTIKIGTTFGRIKNAYEKKATAKPQVIIPRIWANNQENAFDTPVLDVDYIIPFATAGHRNKGIACKVRYTSEETKEEEVQLTKTSSKPRVTVNPFSSATTHNSTIIDLGGLRTIGNRRSTGTLGTV